MQTCVPLAARQWFKLREPVNWAVVIVLFIPLEFIMMLILGGFVASTVSIALMFCLFFFYLDKRSIGIECPRCHNHIETNTPWICGVCGTHNLRTDEFPFVGRCGNKECAAEPKSYQCHHCGELIFFTKDRQTINFATCVNTPVATKPRRVKKDEHVEALEKKKKEIELKKLVVEDTSYDVRLKSLRQSLETPKMKSVEELFRAEVKNEDDARRVRAVIDERFQNDADERKRQHLILDKIMRELP